MEHLPRIHNGKINDLLSDLGQKPETFTGRTIFLSMFNDISCDRKGNKDECLANAGVVKVLARRFGIGQWPFNGPGSEKKWYSMEENSPQGIWDNIADKMLLEFTESGHPVFRATSPLSRGILKSKGHGKLSIHFAANERTIETIFRIIISVNQLSIYGAVAVTCEEFEKHQDRSGEPEVLMGQPTAHGETKAVTPLQNMKTIPNIKFYGNSTWNRSNRFHKKAKCVDSAWKQDLCVLLKWDKYFITKDTGDFKRFRSGACREYTLPRDDPASQPRGWIQGDMRIGPVLEVTTSYMHGKHGIEVRILSVNDDHSQSWVRIPYGTVTYVIDSNHNNTEIPADPHEAQTSQTSVKVIAGRSKSKSKTTKRENLLTHQLPYRCMKENGLILIHQNNLSERTKSRRK